jgi:predicted alpha/beta-hydrolase family hydrolase
LPADLDLLFDGPSDASTTVVLSHGAGAGVDSPFMEFFAKGLARHGYRVVRFDYPYMSTQRRTGKRKPPDREPVLREIRLNVVQTLNGGSPEGQNPGPVICGNSMGGRIANPVADEAGAAGLICLGYPFHPAGKPRLLRIHHLQPEQDADACVLECSGIAALQDTPSRALENPHPTSHFPCRSPDPSSVCCASPRSHQPRP